MNQVLDYSKVCGACSTPLDSPPRDGADSMCAYLHTEQGRADFRRTMGVNTRKQEIVNKTPVNTDLLTDVNTEEPVVNSPELTELTDSEVVEGAAGGENDGKSETRAKYMREYMRRRRAE